MRSGMSVCAKSNPSRGMRPLAMSSPRLASSVCAAFALVLVAAAGLNARPAPDLDVITVLDVGETMIESARQIAAGARLAMYELTPADRIAVMAFGSSPKLYSDFTRPSPEVENTVHRATRFVVRRTGKSVLFDALYSAIQRFPEAPDASRRRAVLVFTDSVDRGSKRSIDDVIQEASRRDVMVCGVVVACSRPFTTGVNACADPDRVVNDLGRVASGTKGAVVVRNVSGYLLREAFARLNGRATWD